LAASAHPGVKLKPIDEIEDNTDDVDDTNQTQSTTAAQTLTPAQVARIKRNFEQALRLTNIRKANIAQPTCWKVFWKVFWDDHHPLIVNPSDP
jgi:hypothetical protein